MFGKLPELFSRNFAIAYFLPVSAFLAAAIGLANVYGFSGQIQLISTGNLLESLIGVTIFGLVSWFGGIVLLASHRDIIRLLEGYGKYNPLRFLAGIERRRFQDLRMNIQKLDIEYDECVAAGKIVTRELQENRKRLLLKATERYPDEEHWLLPTSFGNTIRSFEVYPRIMYGIDAIPAWDRLLTVIPKDFRDLIEDEEAYMGFWVNLGLLAVLMLILHFLATLITRMLELPWSVGIEAGVATIAYLRAGSAARNWGGTVKAAFDMYLPELAKNLGFTLPPQVVDQRTLWKGFSQAILYMRPELLPPRDK